MSCYFKQIVFVLAIKNRFGSWEWTNYYLLSSTCVPCVASFPGLSLFDCPCDFLKRLYKI